VEFYVPLSPVTGQPERIELLISSEPEFLKITEFMTMFNSLIKRREFLKKIYNADKPRPYTLASTVKLNRGNFALTINQKGLEIKMNKDLAVKFGFTPNFAYHAISEEYNVMLAPDAPNMNFSQQKISVVANFIAPTLGFQTGHSDRQMDAFALAGFEGIDPIGGTSVLHTFEPKNPLYHRLGKS